MRVIETRLTYDHGGRVGVHCDYPLGLFITVASVERVEIDRGPNPIILQLDFRPEWALITDVQGVPMTKFRQPEGVTPDYQVHQFYSHNKLYVLEFRFDSIS